MGDCCHIRAAVLVLALAVTLAGGACRFDPSSSGAQDGGDAIADAAPEKPPALDCLDALERGVTTDGVQEIDPDGELGAGQPFDVFCDMTTAGGGWTLVYSYGFTNDGQFNDVSNAITPRPAWPYTSLEAATPVTTTPPVSPAETGAIDFARWGELGHELLVISTINHTIACQPGGGDPVAMLDGAIDCRLVKAIPGLACEAVLPTSFTLLPRGPLLSAGDLFYHWDASLAENWPTHDPCGLNQPNQLAGAADPRGAIYLRRLP